jgi:uncharacterized protein (DUF3820 family)
MNMEEQLLPIVPFGKYKDKSVLDLLADEKYVEWLKQQSWFSNQKQIYNIVVHQTISTTNNSKTPQHNKLQNLFLDTSNQQKLLSKIFKSDSIDGINNLFKEADIIRCFGENIIPEFINKLDKTTIKFEDKFNWDLVMYYYDKQQIEIVSNLETELFDKNKYKQQYDIEQQEIYKNNLLLIDKLIEGRFNLDQKGINKYDEKMREYLDKCEKYENDLKIYLQQKPQNEKDIANYEKKLNVYQTKRDKFITEQTKLICQELVINYHNFVDWDITNNGYSYRDRDTKHTTEEKKQLREIVDDKLKPFIKEFQGLNTRPSFVEQIDIPTKPPLPEKYDYNKEIYVYEKDGEIFKLFEKFKKIEPNMYCSALYSVEKLNKYKKEYEKEYEKKYEKKFNNHYDKYRLQYYIDIIKKFSNKNINIEKINENQYKISIYICHYNYAVCCELKPTLSDDYPVVLRKLKTQIELTKNDKKKYDYLDKKYILIIGSFTSIDVSKEQLITIFNQSNIKVIFTDEIFETSKSVAIKYVNTNITTEQVLVDNKLIEENKILTDNLLQTQQKLLHAEEKIRHLEEEIQSLKSQKQSKSIKDYFGKK